MDVRDVSAAELVGFDAVVHLAAVSNDPVGDLNPETTYEINYRASVRLAELAREAGVERFLFSSSCSVYGTKGDELLDENADFDPVTPTASRRCSRSETWRSSPTRRSAPSTSATRPHTATRRGSAATWS